MTLTWQFEVDIRFCAQYIICYDLSVHWPIRVCCVSFLHNFSINFIFLKSPAIWMNISKLSSFYLALYLTRRYISVVTLFDSSAFYFFMHRYLPNTYFGMSRIGTHFIYDTTYKCCSYNIFYFGSSRIYRDITISENIMCSISTLIPDSCYTIILTNMFSTCPGLLICKISTPDCGQYCYNYAEKIVPMRSALFFGKYTFICWQIQNENKRMVDNNQNPF